MKSTRVFRKFVVVYLLLHLSTALIFLFFASRWISSEMKQQGFLRLEMAARHIRHYFHLSEISIEDPRARSYVIEMGRHLDLRVTLIGNNGIVYADSDSPDADFEDHANRPEIVDAREKGVGKSYRVSGSVAKPLYYLAIGYTEPPVGSANYAEPAGFIRISQHRDDLQRLEKGVLRYLWISGTGLALLSAFFMWRFIQRETKPLDTFSEAARKIAMGQYDTVPLPDDRNDEWRNLSDAFRHMLSELSRRETSLIASSNRNEAVLTSMIEGVLAIDSTGVVSLANDAACEMLRIEQSDLLNRKLLEIVRIPALQQAIEETQLRRIFRRVEFETTTDPKKQIAARVSVMDAGVHPGVAIVMHDVTEIRQLESMRRDFVANVSHELKTPLASIKAYAETLKMGALNDPEKSVQFVSQIETQAELLDQQVQDLLTLAKVESGQAIFNIRPLPIDSICRDCVESYRELADKRAVNLTYRAESEGIVARVDGKELETVVKNLISNALRYTPEKGSVTVSAYREGQTAVIDVTDTGIGIAPEHQPRVFERFYRVDSARSRELGGTGLGLSIVKHLTQSMGGSVHLASQVGKGSQFKVIFPLAK